MKLRKVSLERDFVPNVEFQDFEGNQVRNIDLPESEKIVFKCVLANASQKLSYSAGYTTFNKENKEARMYGNTDIGAVVLKHVKHIVNLDYETGQITTASSFVEKAKNDEILSEMMLDAYNFIMGAGTADISESIPGE